MAAGAQSVARDLRGGQRDVLNLRQTAVRVVPPLQRQHRGADAAALGAYVKAAKARAQPHVVPLPEGAVHIGMKARQPFAINPKSQSDGK